MPSDVLGYDLQIKPSGEGLYDLAFENNDFNLIRGSRSVINGLIFKMLTRPGEIKNPLFIQIGNPAWEELKHGNTELTRETIKEHFSTVITESSRVKSLDLITVDTILFDGIMGVDVYFSFTCIDDSNDTGRVILL